LTVFWVDSYVIKADKLDEYTKVFKKLKTWMEKQPELAKELKSWKVFSHMLGGKWGGYVEMLEFESLAEFEKWMSKLMQSDFMKTFYPEIQSLAVPGSESLEIWNSFM
jgi:hypothetical protein